MSKGSAAVLFTAALLGIVYAGMAVALPAGAFFSADEGVRYLQIDALWRWPWFSASSPAPAGGLDPEGEFAPPVMAKHGKSFPWRFPILFPFLAGFPYLALGVRGALLLPALGAILCMALAARLAGFVMPGGYAGLAGVAAVITTPLVVRGATLRDDTLAALLLTAGLIPVCKSAGAHPSSEPGIRIRQALVGGLLLGLAGAASHPVILMAPAVAVAGLFVWGLRGFGPRALAILTGAALIAVPRALYHGTWDPAMAADPPRLPGAIAARLLPQMARPWFAGAIVLLALLWLTGRYAGGRIRSAVVPVAVLLALALLAAGPVATVIDTVTEAPLSAKERGLGSLANVLPLLALLPLVALPGRSALPHLRFLSVVVLLFVILSTALLPVPSGLAWGPSTLVPVAGLIAIALMALMLDRRDQPGGTLAMVFLWAALAIGVAVQGVGLRFVASVRSYNAGVLEKVRSSVAEDGVILTDLPEIPLLLASLAPETPCLVVKKGADVESLAGRIEESARNPFWIVRDKSKPGFPREAQVALGGGLALLRHEAEADVRGFMRLPAGD